MIESNVRYRYKREDGKIIAGYHIWGDSVLAYWTSDWKVFYNNDSNIPVSIHDLGYYASMLQDPWSGVHEFYIIRPNQESAYKDMPDNVPLFKCLYNVIGYEYMETGIYGFGNTEEEALANCKKHYELIVKTYGKQEEE